MNKLELLQTLQAERAAWEALLAEFNEAEAVERGPAGEWSVKDIVAHVTYYEHWLLNWLEAAVRGKVTVGTHKDKLDVDERNALVFEENKNRTMQDVLSESRRVFEQLYNLVQVLPEEDLVDPHRFERYVMPFWSKSEPLWKCIAGDTFEHYWQHLPMLRARLAREQLQSDSVPQVYA